MLGTQTYIQCGYFLQVYRVCGGAKWDTNSAWGQGSQRRGIQEEIPEEGVILPGMISAFLLYFLSTGSAQVSLLGLLLPHGPTLLSLLPPYLGFDAYFLHMSWFFHDLILVASVVTLSLCLMAPSLLKSCFSSEIRWHLPQTHLDFGIHGEFFFFARYSCRQFAISQLPQIWAFSFL